MVGLGVSAAPAQVEVAVAEGRDTGTQPSRSFFAWGAASYLALTAAILATSLVRTGGRLVYVIDDPAIHLSVAENLVDHGTWGVVPGHFESASSSPLWTLLLGAWLKLAPGPDTVAPLALNLLAGVAAIAVVAAGQRALQPSVRRPADALAVAALVGVVLFLPGLAMTGMEHTLHIALLLAAVTLFHRQAVGRPGVGPPWLAHALLGLATLTRFETVFVALGVGLALFVAPAAVGGEVRLDRLRARAWRPALAVASSFGPLAAFAAFNRLMGQGWLPNSVTAKAAVGTDSGVAFLRGALTRFATDPLVAALAAAALVALLVAQRRWAVWSFPAIVVAVTVALHMLFARMGWYERYQAYLVALGVLFVIGLLGDQLPATRLPPARSLTVAGIVGVALLLTGNKPSATFSAADAVQETYDQRYQAARFLSRYYQGEPIATGELGYISLFHDGPLTDVFGLGDYEVLREWQRVGGVPGAEFWADLAERRRFEVVAVYPVTLFGRVPDSWIPVGTWDVNRWIHTAPGPEFDFYATTPEAVGPLHDRLAAFEDELPDGVSTRLNPLAEFRADQLMSLDD